MILIIKNILIYMVLFLILESCNNKTNEDNQLNDIANYMIINLLQTQELSFPPYYCVKDIDGKLCRIDSIFKNSQLVFRFDDSNCDNCIKSCIELIKKSEMDDHVIGLVTYNSIRMLRFVKKKYDVSFPIYYLPMSDIDMLSDLKEETGYPYFFLLDNNFQAKYFLSPSQQYPGILKEYLNKIAITLKERNKKDYSDLFQSKSKDLGTIVKGTKYKVKFDYTNMSDGLLIINEVKTSCGCIVSKWEKEPLPYQKSASLLIEFTPENLGYTSKTIVIFHNKSNDPIRLIIRANVIT